MFCNIGLALDYFSLAPRALTRALHTLLHAMYKIYCELAFLSQTNIQRKTERSFYNCSFIQRVCVHVGMCAASESAHATALKVTMPGSWNLTHSALTH